MSDLIFEGNGLAANLFWFDDKNQIPPFESEALKAEEEAGENKSLLPFGKGQMILVVGFTAFQFAVFWLSSK